MRQIAQWVVFRCSPVILACISHWGHLYAENAVNSGFVVGIGGAYGLPQGPLAAQFKNPIGVGIEGLWFTGYQYPLSTYMPFFWQSKLQFSTAQLTVSDGSSMMQLGLTAGPGIYFPLSRWFEPYISIGGGINYIRYNLIASGLSENLLKPVGEVGVGIFSSPSRYVALKIGTTYSVSEISGELNQSLGIQASALLRMEVFTSRNLLAKKESLINAESLQLTTVFGARYAQYKDQGVGQVTLINKSNKTLTDIKVETSVPELHSGPTPSIVIKSLAAGEKKTIELPLAFSRKILDISESERLPIELRVYYKSDDGVYSYIEKEQIQVHPKNALTWDNTQHIGSFIAPKEESAATWARNVLSENAQTDHKGIPRKLRDAMLLFDALGGAGIVYATDPNSGFSNTKKVVIDYVMFARETLKKKAGDCDDLTVLYSTLLESIGIKTAVVTIPGHIYMMFDTEVPANSYRNFADRVEMIYDYNGTAWIPVEITMVGKSFHDAWAEGAKNTGKHVAMPGAFEFVPADIAWKKFSPADIGAAGNLDIPSRDKVQVLYALDLDMIHSNGYVKAMAALQNDLKASTEPHKVLTAMGITSGKFGLYKEAEEYLAKAIQANANFAPAYSNMANVHMLNKDFAQAVTKLEKAVALDAENHKYRISLARALFEAGSKARAKEEFERALKQYPGYKESFAYLGSDPNARAADPQERLNYNLWVYP